MCAMLLVVRFVTPGSRTGDCLRVDFGYSSGDPPKVFPDGDLMRIDALLTAARRGHGEYLHVVGRDPAIFDELTDPGPDAVAGG